MGYFAGLDVSVKETSVCIVDDAGKIVREARVASEPEALLQVLTNTVYRFKRVGLYRPVHVKTLRSQKLRVLLTHRKLLQSKAIAIENDLRATLRNFGLKVGTIGTIKYETRIRELVENLPDLAVLVEPLLIVRRVVREQLGILHRRLLVIVRDDDVCRRLMTIPGVGPVVALTYRVTVDVPARFRNSKAVGAVFGLTPAKYQSGENDRTGAISRCGDEMMRI